MSQSTRQRRVSGGVALSTLTGGLQRFVKRSRKTCAHCGSLKLEYCAYALSGCRQYYKCSDCRKYTEYYISPKDTVVAIAVLLVLSGFALAVDIPDSRTRVLYYIALAVLATAILYRFKRGYSSVTPLENLPHEDGILSPPSREYRVFVAVVAIGFVVYAVIFLWNLITH